MLLMGLQGNGKHMGLTKAYLNQPNHTETGRLVCTNCIYDDGLKKVIELNHEEGVTCSYCNGEGSNSFICSLNTVIEHIYQSLGCEYGDPNDEGVAWNGREGGWQGAYIYNSTTDLLDDILSCQCTDAVYEDICNSIDNETQWCDRNPYLMRGDEILSFGWKNFCSFIKHRYRYFFMGAANLDYDSNQPDEINPVEILSHLSSIVRHHENSITKITKDSDIYRVRIIDKNAPPLSTATDLGSPPEDAAIYSNRMSPAGISMFYGAFDLETAICESWHGESNGKKVAYGIFSPTRDLTVLNLCAEYSVPSLFDEQNRTYRSSMKFMNNFIKDFCKPIQKDGKEHIKYVPTQVVTEYFRNNFKTGDNINIDGIMYLSSKNDKKSIVLFANSNQCQDMLLLNITKDYDLGGLPID